MEPITFTPSRTTKLFYKINLMAYIFGCPNFWIENLKLSKRFYNIYNRITTINNFLIYFWMLFEYGAFFTQNNLSKKQSCNLLVFGISHPILWSYRLILTHYKEKTKALFLNLAVTLKNVYNDPEVETNMIAKTTLYIYALGMGVFSSMFMYTFDACIDVIQNGGTFTTIVTAYPDVKDKSNLANVVRAICYCFWWIYISRGYAAYILVVPLTTSLSHQYKNLQSYFYKLNQIFDRDDLNQNEKESQYEKEFIVGVQLHVDTIRCIQQFKTVCGVVFSGQIVLNLIIIIILMIQLVNSEHSLSNMFSTLITASAILICTGFFMWNAGDVTVEASRLSTAIYFSGWENCHGRSTRRIRKMVTIAINHAQRPVILKGLGYIELSYQSYLTIVKASYSVFSVLA